MFVVYFVLFSKGFFADKAHRKKQGEGVVPYVEPLLRSNKVCEKRFGKHNVGGTADFFSKFVPDRDTLSGILFYFAGVNGHVPTLRAEHYH